MSDHDLLAGAIAGRLRLQPDVRQLYPPRPRVLQPVETLTALLGRTADQTAVTITGDDPLRIEASIGIPAAASAIAVGRAGLTTITETLPTRTACRITLRIATID